MKRLLLVILCFAGLIHDALSQCAISNLVVEPFGCEDGFFYIAIDFDIVNPEGEVFGVVGNATDYGFFKYDTLPAIIGPLPGDGTTIWQFIIYDLGDPNCQVTYVLGTFDCCTISNVSLTVLPCQNTSTYQARVNFTHSNTGNVGFDAFDANGNFLGFFQYTALPVTITGIPSFGEGNTHITICDNNNDDCCTVVQHRDPDCDNSNCEIFDLDIDVNDDCEQGQFTVTVNFMVENTGPGFSVDINGVNYGMFAYTSRPLTIGPLEGDGETAYEIVVTDLQFDGCSETAIVPPVDCPIDCGFLEETFAPVLCQGEDHYSLEIDFVPAAVGNQGFSVYARGESLGSFAYSALPVIVDSFPTSGGFYDSVMICDNLDATCCEIYEFVALRCDECLIYNLDLDYVTCDDNGQFFISLDFDYNMVGDEFQVGGGGMVFGPFSYDSLPVVLGPFNGDSLTFHELLVLDLDGGFACFNGIEIGLVDCDCGFEDINVIPVQCTGNGLYSLMLDFDPIEVTNEGFNVYAGDEFVGFYLYEDLPVLVETFPDFDGTTDVITICDDDNPTCCASHEFQENLDCSCEITGLAVEAFPCDSAAGSFSLVVDVQWEGVAETFDILMGDDSIATLSAANLPDTITGLVSRGGVVAITAIANETPDCEAIVEAEVPQCPVCDIFELVAEALPCDDQINTFGLVVNFGTEGFTEQFDVFVAGTHVGIVETAQLPDTIYGLTSPGGLAEVRVSAVDNEDCTVAAEIEVPECPYCDILNLKVLPLECDIETNTYSLVVDLDIDGVGEIVDVLRGEELIGTFDHATLPDTIHGLIGSGGVVITACVRDNPQCCASVEIQQPCAACEIFDIVADPGACTSDSTFSLAILYDYAGFTTDSVEMWTEAYYLGRFHVDSMPVEFNDFPYTGSGAVSLTICQSGDPECCETFEFLFQEICGCGIEEVIVEPLGFCNPDTLTFPLYLDVEWLGDIENFDVFADGEFLTTIPSVDLPDTLLTFPVPDSGRVSHIRVCAENSLECCVERTFTSPNCDTCSIFNVDVAIGNCTTDSTFSATVFYQTFGFTGDVAIWVDDVYLGQFPQIVPLLLSRIPDGDGVRVLEICQFGNPECCIEIEFDGIPCGTCEISNLTAELDTCIGLNFSVTLDFKAEDVGSIFTVEGNGISHGIFNYNQVPVRLGPFPGDSMTEWEFIVRDLETPGCLDIVDVGIVDCTVALFELEKAIPLAIYYGTSGAFFIAPEDISEYSLWTYDGRLIHSDDDLQAGNRILLTRHISIPGIYFVQVRAGDRMYVGKVVDFRE